jgi:15-cis-phytoene synthase
VTDSIQELVAKGDKDRYLSCLFAPDAVRPHLFALYAFNLEISRIRDVVSEPQIGLVRQQWWLDSIDGIYAGNTQEHPVAVALAAAIMFAKLPKEPLRNLIIAREFDLYDDAMPTLNDLEGYLGETSSSLMQMAALILGKSAADVAGLAGVAFGIADVLRSARKSFLPADMVQGLGEAETVKQLCAHARKRLGEARALEITPDVLPAFLPASLTELYLARIERGGSLHVSQFRRQISLWRAARHNRF